MSTLAALWTGRFLVCRQLLTFPAESVAPPQLTPPDATMDRLVRSATQRTGCVRSRSVDTAAAFPSVARPLSTICFPVFSWFVTSTSSVDMGKKEEEDIIRIAKKMDKMAQKKNGVRRLRRINASRYLRRADEARVNIQLSLALMDCDGVSCLLANLTSSPEHLSHLQRTTSDVREVYFPTESYFLPLSSQN